MIGRPIGRKILVKQEDVKMESDKGIILRLDNVNYFKPQIGKIIAVSNQVEEEGVLSVGDRIFFSMYAGANAEYKGVKYVVMNRMEVFGIVGENSDLEVGQTNDTEALLQGMEHAGIQQNQEG